MPAKGRPWRRISAQFRDECKKVNAACWLCQGSKGPINYYAKPGHPLSFSVDHATPTSLGGDTVSLTNLKPSHFGCNSSRGNTTRGQFPTARQWLK